MADVVEWDSTTSGATGGGNRGSGNIRNLRLQPNVSVEVRFVGHPVKFFKYFIQGKSAIVKDPVNNPIKQVWNQDATTRYGANVLNRADSQVWLYEFPPSVYNAVCAWGSARKTDPGGKSGCNFQITQRIKNKKTEYEIIPLDITPFTDAEKEYLRANIYDLTKLFKETANEDLEKKLQMGAAPVAPAAPAQAPAPVGAEKDLPF